MSDVVQTFREIQKDIAAINQAVVYALYILAA